MPWNPKDYPPSWPQIRTRILQRAGNCCEECGAPNGKYIYRLHKGKPDWILSPEDGKHQFVWLPQGEIKCTKIVLTIAHLDHDKENWAVTDERLKAWCQRCHLNYDRKNHERNRRYGRDHKKNNFKLDL